MEIATDLTPLEILGVAIRSEIEAADLYRHMLAQVVNRDLRGRLEFLVREEEKHRRILEELYARRFPGVELALPARSLVPTIQTALREDTPIPELFRLAMEAERLSEEFYRDQAGRAEEANSRATLTYLSRMERGHYELLRGEFELIQRYPSYYQVETFHPGEELMHIGP
ncbi:MAG: ferritin family protein [Chloroflexia bacterium]